MSGGSWDYVYARLEKAAIDLRDSGQSLRRLFGDHLLLCAEAMHDIEWVDSSDYSPGDEEAAIRKVLRMEPVPAPGPLTPEERAAIRRDHEQRFVACSCNWSTPCVTIQLLDELEALIAKSQ